MSGIFVAIAIMTGMSFSIFTARDVHRILQLSSSVSSNQQPRQVLLPAPDSNVESKGLQNSKNEILREKLAYAGDSELLKRPAKHTLNINSSEQNPLEKQNDSNDTAGQPSESMQHQEAPVTLGPAEVLLPVPDNNAGLNGLQHSENNMSQEKPAGDGDSELLTKKELNINEPEQNPLKKQNDSNDAAGQPSESMPYQEAPVTLGLAEVMLPAPDNSAGLNDLQDSPNNNIPQEKQDDSNDTTGQHSGSMSHQEAPLTLGPAQILLPAFGQQCRLSSSSEF